MQPPSELDAIRNLAAWALECARATELEGSAGLILERLDQPLRVAIAGRVKAGKSTLLNALVGERVAATDASECTRVVTWYRHGLGYRVQALLADGDRRDIRFRRAEGRLEVALDDLDPGLVERIEVEWPSSRLTDLTLLDTPGLASANEELSRRTMTALVGADADDDLLSADAASAEGDADAVIYLMRHLHQRDAEFLESFVAGPQQMRSPVGAIAVLSRADELGAGRPDALDSAARIAARYQADERLQSFVSAVIPVCALLAETAATLREDEFAAIWIIAQLETDLREDLLISVDRFRSSERNPLDTAMRERLLGRFGFFGLRESVDSARDGRVKTATDLSSRLMTLSGIAELERLIAERFATRSRSLRARSALGALRPLASALVALGAAGGERLALEVERAQTGSTELALLRLLHLSLTGRARFSEEERAEVERLASTGTLQDRLGIDAASPPEASRAAALAGIERWRVRTAGPLIDRPTFEAAELAARAYESLYAAML